MAVADFLHPAWLRLWLLLWHLERFCLIFVASFCIQVKSSLQHRGTFLKQAVV